MGAALTRMRTRLSVCRRKVRHPTREVAIAAAVALANAQGGLARPYACDRCEGFHLTSRRRGGWIPRVIRAAARTAVTPSGTGAERL